MQPVRVTTGEFRGALVVVHFVNPLGNYDCRFAEDFGPHRKGEIVVLHPSQVGGMTFSFFSVVNRTRCESPEGFNHALNSWSLSDWLTATMGELGEAANIAKKLNRIRDGIPGNKETEKELRAGFRKEIADVFIYLDLLAQAAGFTLESVVREKFNETSQKLDCPIQC